MAEVRTENRNGQDRPPQRSVGLMLAELRATIGDMIETFQERTDGQIFSDLTDFGIFPVNIQEAKTEWLYLMSRLHLRMGFFTHRPVSEIQQQPSIMPLLQTLTNHLGDMRANPAPAAPEVIERVTEQLMQQIQQNPGISQVASQLQAMGEQVIRDNPALMEQIMRSFGLPIPEEAARGPDAPPLD